MFNKFRKARRGVSEVLATVIIISLVLAATALVSVILTNVNVVDLFGISVVPETKEVNLSMDVQLINSTDGDARIDTVIVFLSLDADSPNIYIQDADIQLPTGETVDDIVPWSIVTTSQSWNSEFNGFTIMNGHVNTSFTVQINDFLRNDAELITGSTFSLVFYYTYLSILSGRELTISGYFVSQFLVAP